MIPSKTDMGHTPLPTTVKPHPMITRATIDSNNDRNRANMMKMLADMDKSHRQNKAMHESFHDL